MKSFDLSVFLQRKYQGIMKNKEKKLEKFQSSSAPLFSRMVKLIPRQISPVLFMICSLILVTAILGINNYHNSFFHTVYFEGQEIGLVEEVEKVEDYVDELVQAKSSKYETKVEPVENITFDEPEFYFLGEENMENIENVISNNLNFYTWSYLVTIDDEVSVNLHDRDDYEKLMENLKAKFLPGDDEESGEIIEIRPAEKIKGEWVKVNPAEVLTLNEAMAFFSPDDSDRTYLASRDGGESGAFRSYAGRGGETERYTGHPINIISVEKEVEEESISYETTYENCDETKEGQTEVKSEGEEGTKEIVYHLTKENGEEIDREKVEENVIEEPTEEVIIRGTKKETPSFERSDQANTTTGQPSNIQEGSGQFIWPIPRSYDGGGRITRHFSGAHSGIDIYASTLTSTPIIAADSGTVVDTSYHGSYGKLVVINHGNYYTVYAHCSSVKVSNGQNVSKGENIAYMGNTGATFGRTGIHLHFEIRANTSANWMSARKLNPMSFF